MKKDLQLKSIEIGIQIVDPNGKVIAVSKEVKNFPVEEKKNDHK